MKSDTSSSENSDETNTLQELVSLTGKFEMILLSYVYSMKLRSLRIKLSTYVDLDTEVQAPFYSAITIRFNVNHFLFCFQKSFKRNKESESSDILGDAQPSTSTMKICDDAVHTSTPPRTVRIADSTAGQLENKSGIITDFSDLDSIFDSPRKQKLRKDLRRRILIQKKHTLKISSLRRKTLRLKKKVASFKKILATLKNERYITNETHDALRSNVFAADLYATMKKKIQGKSKRPVYKYKPEFRKFCLTLHFLSPNAYRYVRRKFATCLPHPKTISKWYANIDGSPGLTGDAFKVLAAKRKQSESNLPCALIVDEMAIRQQRCYNEKTRQEEGLVDMGTGPNENINIKASEAYVFLLVSLNEPWKMPVAYFLIHGLAGDQKANIIKTVLNRCHEVGVDVVSLTFDGHSSNLAAMKELGCRLDDPRQLKTTFKHPSAEHEVAVFLDFCHMIKLIRNHFRSKEIFLHKYEQIRWDHVEKLVEMQEEIGLHLANRLTKRHIQFQNSIMNVKLATQLLSRSVSKALEFCRQELKLIDFADSAGTEKFIMILNNAFDIFNSRNFKDYGYKRPLSAKNKDEAFAALEEAQDLILNLSLKVSRKRTYREHQIKKKIILKSYAPVLKSQSFTGFLGVLICINSLKALYKTLIESNTMKYITTYRISQDHVELFFGSIRMHGGFNDNPNARQFKGIYRKLLCHMELKSAESGNCMPVENISILMCSSALKCINETAATQRKDDEDENEKVDESLSVIHKKAGETSRLLDDPTLAEYTKQIVGYVAGFVVRCLSRQIKCTACIESLLAKEKLDYHKLVNNRDKGGLIYASPDVYSVCNATENVIRMFLKQNFPMTSKKFSTIVSAVMKKIISSKNSYFSAGSEHVCGSLHQVNLIRLVAEKYLCIRCYHICKLDNVDADANSKRKLYKKQIQREGH